MPLYQWPLVYQRRSETMSKSFGKVANDGWWMFSEKHLENLRYPVNMPGANDESKHFTSNVGKR